MSIKLDIAKEQIKESIERKTIRVYKSEDGSVSCHAYDNPISFGPFQNMDALIHVFAYHLVVNSAKTEEKLKVSHLEYIRNRYDQTKELIEIGNTLFELFNNFENDPFKNSVTEMGSDEGSVKGWKFVDELKFKWKNIIKNLE